MTAEKTKKKAPDNQIIDDVYEEYQEKKSSINNSNALVKDVVVVENQLSKIEEQLTAIVDRQKNGVSAEFNALMDGYVNKANESQEFKVKASHLESVYEELKIEAKTLSEENKKFKAELEASKEALRMSEADIKRLNNEAQHSKNQLQEQITALNDERENLKTKLRDVQGQNDQNLKNYNAVKSELLELRYKVKQIEQEKQVEDETSKRANRENTKVIDELKEKLELRTREVEYKDALLNQLIKQVSVEDNVAARINTVMPQREPELKLEKKEEPKSFFEQEEVIEEPKQEEKPRKESSHKSLRESIKSRFARKDIGSSWGPFKRR